MFADIYTPSLRCNEKTNDMEDVEYDDLSAQLPFDHDENNGMTETDKTEADAAMEEEVDPQDMHHIVTNEFNQNEDGIRCLVSMTRTANMSEKHEVPDQIQEVESQEEMQRTESSAPHSTENNRQNKVGSNKGVAPKKRGRPRKHPPKEVKNPRGPYRKYTDQYIVELIDLIQNVTLSVPEAARLHRMPERSAYNYWNRFCSNEPYLPSQFKKSKGTTPILTSEHTKELQKMYDDNAATTIAQAQNILYNKYNISITKSGLQKHLVKHCGLTMKKLTRISEARNSAQTIKKRMNWVLEVNKSNIDFSTCVFIDEAGFNLHIKRTFGRSRRGEPAKVLVPSHRGVNISILGAIVAEGVVNLSLRKPQSVVGSKKKRKLNEGKQEFTGKIGTRAVHFVQFLETVMDILDKNNMPGKTLVLDNASIHHTNDVKELVESRGFKLLYLPPYSPFLNPIEEFWSKLKAGVKRELLTKDDSLTPRIMNSAYDVTVNDCKGWIRHSMSFFPRCLNNEQML